MSITISNCDEICHSPTNQSKSKMLYTFSKENRFSKRRVILYHFSLNIDAINIMIAKVLILQEPQDLVMALSMILLKSTLYNYLVLPNHHHLLLIV